MPSLGQIFEPEESFVLGMNGWMRGMLSYLENRMSGRCSFTQINVGNRLS
jgi:hypothetical protein